jgi:uncharacterized protein YndB with AHSA1/START domain
MTAIADLTPGEQIIVISRVFDAPRELVFSAFTEPRHLSQFWGPKGFSCPSCQVDLRVGEQFRVDMRGPDGGMYPCTGIYREIVKPERIVYDSTADDGHPCGGGLPPRAVVTMNFADVGGKTKLTIHTRLQSAADRDAAIAGGFNQGWNDSLDRLTELLSRLRL